MMSCGGTPDAAAEEGDESSEQSEQEGGSGRGSPTASVESAASSESDADVGGAVVQPELLFRCEECFRLDSSVHKMYTSFPALKAHVLSVHTGGHGGGG
jgi:hypothetical protein